MFKRLLRKLGPVLSASLFILALLTLYNELKSVHYHEVMQNISLLPRWRIWLAFVLTAVSFFCLTLYDALASRYIRRSIDYSKMALAAFVSYSFSNTVGYSLLTSAPLRYRFYTVWGLSAVEITKLIGFVFLTYWVGLVSVAGFALVVHPDAITSHFDLPVSALPLGAFFWIVLAVYLLATVLWKKSVRIRGEEVFLPPLHLALGQVAAGCLDWFAAAAVLYILLPAGNTIGYLPFLGVFVLAQAVGGLSNVPGGLGVFETVMLHLLTPAIPPPQVFASLILYRVIYYLIPLMLATMLLGADEAMRRSESLRDARTLLLRWGIRRWRTAVYMMAILLVAAGIVYCLLRGFDYTAAIILTAALTALMVCRKWLTQSPHIVKVCFTTGWTISLIAVLTGAAWLAYFGE